MKINRWNPYLALIAGIIIASALTMIFDPEKNPKDTFTDPQLAYAELQKAFGIISDKMDEGMEMMAAAAGILEIAEEIPGAAEQKVSE